MTISKKRAVNIYRDGQLVMTLEGRMAGDTKPGTEYTTLTLNDPRGVPVAFYDGLHPGEYDLETICGFTILTKRE